MALILCCSTITTIFKYFLLSPKALCNHLTMTPHSPLLPSPGNLQNVFGLCLFQIHHHISGIKQQLPFCILFISWGIMFLKFNHVIAHVKTSFLLLAICILCILFIHYFDEHLGSFHFLAILNKHWTYRYLFEPLLLIL